MACSAEGAGGKDGFLLLLLFAGKTDEAIELLRQLPRDDPELNAYLSIAYKELRNESEQAALRSY